jgi:hypothetical protein
LARGRQAFVCRRPLGRGSDLCPYGIMYSRLCRITSFGRLSLGRIYGAEDYET